MAVSALYGSESVLASPAVAAVTDVRAPQQTAASAADPASARVAARLYGHPVEALSERSETTTTWANKDGSLTTEVAAGPIRFKDPATGEWRDVDVELAAASDGSVVSKAHPQGLKLAGRAHAKSLLLRSAPSTAGTDLVTLGQGEEAITLQWRGGLPAPVLDGTRATYAEAVPGADVVVEATRTGFEQFVEVKAKPAAGFGYTLPLKSKGLKVEQQADGSVLFTDKKSKKTATMPAPVMWDASTDAVSGEHTRRAKVDLKVVKTKDGVDLVITPDAGFLADPATKYPVTVDPSTSALGNLFDTYVQQGETVDWSNDTELDLGNPGTKNADGTFRTARSFITWNTAPVADALISSAQLSLWNFHSGNTDCTAQPWEVWTANNASTASRWTNQPAMVTKMATSTETKGNPACTSAPDGWVNANVTSLVQQWANNKWAYSGMGLRATDENNTKQWKRVNSANAASNVPKLTVTYNYRPKTGTKQEAGAPFFSYGGEYVVNSTTPTLRDTFTDANGDKVNGTFQIFDAATDTEVVSPLVSPWVSSGQVAAVTVPAGILANGKTYKFRTSPYDGTHYNAGWSPWKTFRVDTSAPSAPTGLGSVDYPASAWTKGAGQSGQFTATPPAGGDHNWLEWSLDGTTWTKVATDGAAGAKTFPVTPPHDGTQTLQVRAVDRADNKSEPVDYTFHAGPGGFSQPSDGERTARRLPLAAEADGTKYDSVSYAWRRSEADPWVSIPVGDVTADGTPLTAWPVPLTAGKSATLTWNATSTVDPDGSVEIKADFTGPGGATAAGNPLTVVVDRGADNAATDQIGPGSLNLLTGNYSLTASDASYYAMSVIRTASSRSPQAGAAQQGQAAIFGAEWVSGTVAALADSNYVHIRKVSDTAVAVVKADDAEVHFTATASRTGWVPEPGSESLTLTGSTGGTFTLTDTDGAETVFTKPAGVATWQVSSSKREGLDTSVTTQTSETVTVNGTTLARPKLVIAPSSAHSNDICASAPTTKGCRVLEYVYATNTTATAGSPGDYAGRVKEILLYATAKDGASSEARAVSAYRYDEQGRLRQQWNPRLAESTGVQYGYDSAGRVTTYRSTSDQPWTLTYGRAGNSPQEGDGMLLKASRPALKRGTVDVIEGEAVKTVVYNVPTGGATAPYQMGANDVKAWGQTHVPTDATAVFAADSVPASNSGSSLGAGAYARADISYLGVSGRTVNTVTPGGHVTTMESDRFGNLVRELSAANRDVALGTTASDRATQADLGIGHLPSSERALLLSTTSVHDARGIRELEEFGPLSRVTLTSDLKSGATVLVSAGTSVTARSWKVNEFDSGRPTDGTATVKDQPTRVTTGTQVREHPTVQGEARATQTVYDWTRGLPVQKIQDPGGLAITTTYEYDAKGQVTKQLDPASNGSDAAAQVTSYWSATGTGPCGGRPEWADLLCSTGPGGDITGGGSNPNQPATTGYEYESWGTISKITNSANGSTRTTTTTYDGAGRATTVAVTGGVGEAVAPTSTEYDGATGRVKAVTSTTAGTITKQYDTLGRQISYTDADGGRTSTQYDLLDRPVEVGDTVPSTVTFTYDHAAEPRGLATRTTDSVAGSFSAAYDSDGAIRTEGLPGGYTLTIGTDTTGAPTGRKYTRDSDSALVYSDTATESAQGQTVTHSGWSDQSYRYDAAGRLVTVEDTAATVCTRRDYTFDSRTNRTSRTAAASAPGANCPATGGTTTTTGYDSADRPTAAGYGYDAFGRTTTLPGGVSVGYYANDVARQQTTATQRQTWQLDPAQRLRSWTAETKAAGSWIQAGSKVNHFDCDSDKPRWIVEDTASGALTRNVDSLSGDLGATTSATGDVVLHLATLHGDVALQLPLDASRAPVALDSDEYGSPRPGQQAARYGWLGAKMRSAETPAGHSLMGARLYDPAVGRFLSVDPVHGGGANRYGYPGDPVNQNDLDGRAWKCKAKCQLAGSGPNCSGYVWGAGSGANEDQAVKDAKRDAVNQAPRGCYARHCKAYDCTKNRARQWWDGNYDQRTMHRHNPPDWMRRANYYSWGILYYSQVWRGTSGSWCGCSP